MIGQDYVFDAENKVVKNKKVEPLSYLFSLKLTNLTKPKLMKKNVLQIYAIESKQFENNCKMMLKLL